MMSGASAKSTPLPQLTKLTGLVADLSLQVAFDGLVPPKWRFGRPVSGTWGQLSLDVLEGELEAQGEFLRIALHPKGGSNEEEVLGRLHELHRLLNEPVHLALDDGSDLWADFGSLSTVTQHIGPNAKPPSGSGRLYRWQHRDPARAQVWMGEIQGRLFRIGNLRMAERFGASGRRVGDALRLVGSYAWHLIVPGDAPNCIVIIDTSERALDRNLVLADFKALQFASGLPLKLDTLVGLDRDRRACAAIGLALGIGESRDRGLSDGPVPDRFERERWRPILFNKVAMHLAKGGIALDVPIAAYLDTKLDHLDGAYLKAQIALEAFCGLIVGKREQTVLVKDSKAWIAWVESTKEVIQAHATDAEAGKKLLGKVISAQNRPTTDTVEDGLERLQLAVPKDLLKEVAKRNTVAHRYLMNQADPRDIQADVYRLDRIKTLLAAVVARVVGYDGPITGWERDETGWPIDPDWLPKPVDTSRALEHFVCERERPAESATQEQGSPREPCGGRPETW
jgi:hypothetical protein